jgi:hypothetical protein
MGHRPTSPGRPVSTLPAHLNKDPDFRGRDGILEEIETHLKKYNSIALAGYGGIG